MLKIAFAPIYIYDLPDGHRFPMIKYQLIPEQLLHEGTITEANFFEPSFLSDDRLLRTHSSDYVKSLYNLPLERRAERDIGFPVKPELIRRGRHIAQGTLECALYALNHGVAINVAGGTHHAFADKGEGFCVFNDFAITANELLSQDLVNQILIVDLDVHQGNGTAKIFEDETRVFTWSVHGDRNYPLRKMNSDLDTPLPDGTEDDLYLTMLRNELPRLIDLVQPDMILYLAGVDVLDTDKLGRLSLTRAGCKERDRFVFDTCKKNNIPVAVSMGGGYSHRVADIVEAHANTFRVAQDIFF